MKINRFLLPGLFSLALSVTSSHAGKATDLKPILAQPGAVLVEEGFDAPQLGKRWAANKGDWQPKDGTLFGKEKKSDAHPAVLTLGQTNRNSLIRFSFRLDAAKSFNLSYNHAKGHLFRVVVTPTGLTVNKDKDKKNPASKGAVLGKADAKFEPGQWYTMLVEVQGDKVSVQTDNGVKLQAGHPELDVDKPGYRFVTAGESLVLDDVKVWRAQ
jgi:hypothetical protein